MFNRRVDALIIPAVAVFFFIVCIDAIVSFLGYVLLLGICVMWAYIFLKGTTMNILEKLFGKSIVSMKLEAIAKYLKVNFIHVPEHYECKKIAKSTT